MSKNILKIEHLKPFIGFELLFMVTNLRTKYRFQAKLVNFTSEGFLQTEDELNCDIRDAKPFTI